eukprot:5066429-Amphidinium_carterae.1
MFVCHAFVLKDNDVPNTPTMNGGSAPLSQLQVEITPTNTGHTKQNHVFGRAKRNVNWCSMLARFGLGFNSGAASTDQYGKKKYADYDTGSLQLKYLRL